MMKTCGSPDEDFRWKSKRSGTNNFLVVIDEFYCSVFMKLLIVRHMRSFAEHQHWRLQLGLCIFVWELFRVMPLTQK